MGAMTLTDELFFYVAVREDTTSILTVAASINNTVNGTSLTNTQHSGATFYLNVNAVSVTCTIALNVQGKDPVSNNYLTIARASIDAVAATAVSAMYGFQLYPTATVGGSTTNPSVSAILPRVFRLVASITASTTTTCSLNFTTGLTRQL